MSKFSEQMEKDLDAIKKGTQDLIRSGGKLAFEKYHEETSLKELENKLREGK